VFLGEVVHDGVDRVDELVVGERDALVSRHGAIVISRGRVA
jgi:hypothetical protein